MASRLEIHAGRGSGIAGPESARPQALLQELQPELELATEQGLVENARPRTMGLAWGEQR